MIKAQLNNENIATSAGSISVFNYDADSREYLSSTDEYLAVGVGIPAHSCTDAPSEVKNGFIQCRTADLTSWEYIADHRNETVFSIKTGEKVTITELGDYPEGTTTLEPATQYDTWDGDKWITDMQAQLAANHQIATQKKQQLIDNAMQSISVVQLKLQAGRTLTDTEKAKLNTMLDYIDAISAIDTSTGLDINWPPLPVR